MLSLFSQVSEIKYKRGKFYEYLKKSNTYKSKHHYHFGILKKQSLSRSISEKGNIVANNAISLLTAVSNQYSSRNFYLLHIVKLVKTYDNVLHAEHLIPSDTQIINTCWYTVGLIKLSFIFSSSCQISFFFYSIFINFIANVYFVILSGVFHTHKIKANSFKPKDF